MSEKELADPTMPPPLKAYMAALKRQQSARESLAKRLADLGMRIVWVPGLNDHEVGVNYVNGIHLPGKYVMPVFGGWFEPLDRAAAERIKQAFGPSVAIVPIMAGMAQESDGGLHCMVGLHPRM
jgi:agmatine/peptidylarginine deiminase